MALSEFPRLGFDPFVELRRMQSEMNRLFSGFSTTATRDFPPINIWLGENSVVVTAELPGVTGDDVNLSLQEDVLTLSGKREPRPQQQNVSWQRRERAYGSFSRAVQLPFRVDPAHLRLFDPTTGASIETAPPSSSVQWNGASASVPA